MILKAKDTFDYLYIIHLFKNKDLKNEILGVQKSSEL